MKFAPSVAQMIETRNFQTVLDACAQNLTSHGILETQQRVDRIAAWLIESGAPAPVREAFCSILIHKADETTNRAVAIYLRTVSKNLGCISDFDM